MFYSKSIKMKRFHVAALLLTLLSICGKNLIDWESFLLSKHVNVEILHNLGWPCATYSDKNDQQCFAGTTSRMTLKTTFFVGGQDPKPGVNEPGFKCVPGKVFKADCNTCSCDNSGTLARCTAMACPPEERTKRAAAEEPCMPGDVKMLVSWTFSWSPA